MATDQSRRRQRHSSARALRAPLRDFCARLPPSATPRRSPQPASPVCVRRCRDSKQAVTLTHKVANQVQNEEEKKRSATHMRCTRAHTKSPRHGHQHTQVETREPRSAACHVHQKGIHPIQLLLVSKLHDSKRGREQRVQSMRGTRQSYELPDTMWPVTFFVGSHGRTRSVPSAACSLAHPSFAKYPCTVHGMNDTCFCCLSYFSCLCSM